MELNVNDLGLVQKEIFKARTNRYDIGLELNVQVDTLESIKSQCSDPKVCLRETLKVWLKTAGKTTWKNLVDALRSPTVNESQLAAELKERYCVEALVKENKEQAQQIQDLNQQVKGLQTEIEQLKQQLLEARAQNLQEIQHLRQELETRDQQLQQKDQLQLALEASQQEIQQLRQDQQNHKLEERDRQVQETKEIIQARQSEIQQVKQELESRDQQLKDKDRKIQEKDEALVARQKEIEKLRLELHAEEAEKSPATKKRRKNADLHLRSIEQSQAEATSGIQEKFNWKELSGVPEELLYVNSAIMDGKMVYVSDDVNIYVCNVDKMEWNLLRPICPYSLFSLVVIKGQLTIIGGCKVTHQHSNSLVTNSLLNLIRSSTGIGRTWSKQFPPMPTARIEPAVACSEEALIVAGGYTTHLRHLMCTQIEVMDTETKQWFTASQQLQEWCTITNTSDTLYIYTCTAYTPQIIACCITNLLQLGSSQDDIWSSISTFLADKPTIAIIRGQLTAINNGEFTDNNEIHAWLYDSNDNFWKVFRNTPTLPKEAACVKSFSGNGQIIIVGFEYQATCTIFIPDFSSL